MKNKQRTLRQNRSLYRYFKMVSDEAMNSGSTFSGFIRKRPVLEMPWTPERVKEVWKTAAKHMYGIDSTADLTTKQVKEVYDVCNKVFGEVLQIHVPWPEDLPPPEMT